MSVHAIDSLLAEHPFFVGLDLPYLELIAGCAANVRFAAGELIFQEGGAADRFYLLRFGRVRLEIFTPAKGAVSVETLGQGDVLGFSWLLEPYRWHHDARAIELTRAVAFDGQCLRDKCDADPRLGYELMKRFAQVIVRRLREAELQLLDLYGHAPRP